MGNCTKREREREREKIRKVIRNREYVVSEFCNLANTIHGGDRQMRPTLDTFTYNNSTRRVFFFANGFLSRR